MATFTPSSPAGDDGAADQPSPFPVGDHDFVLTNHANLIDDHTGALRAHDETLQAIVAHLAGSPGGPWQWESLDKVQAQKLWGELIAFVDFLDRRYLRYLGGQGARIVADWYKHPVLVELFTALMVAYQHAYAQNSRVPSFALVEWHERCLWPTFDRIEKLRLLQGSTDQDEWDGPEALPTHDGHPDRLAAFLTDDLNGRRTPETGQKKKSAEPPTVHPRAARPVAVTAANVQAAAAGPGSTEDMIQLSDEDAPETWDAPPPPDHA